MIGNRKFWDGVAMGAAAGALISLVLLRRRRPDLWNKPNGSEPYCKTAMGKAQNTLGQLAGKLSDR